MHAPSDLFEQTISLLHVVTSTGRHHVGPFMAATSTARNDVVNGVGVLEAVGAAIAIAKQERTSRQGRSSHFGGQLHHVVESHDGRDLDHQRRRPTDVRILRRDDRFGSPGEHQDDRATFAHELQRLERGVEEQDAAHGRPTGWASAQRAASTIDAGLSVVSEPPLTVANRNSQ